MDVLINFKYTTTDSDEVLATLAQSSKAEKGLADAVKKANSAFSQQNKLLSQGDTEVGKFVNSIKNLPKNVLGAASKDAQAFIKSVQKGELQVNKLATGLGLAKKRLDELQPGTKEFEQLSKEIQATTVVTDKLNKVFTSAPSKVEAMREALLELENQGLDNTEAFADLLEQSAALTDQIGDTQARIQALASDTLALDASVQGIEGIAAAFSVAQGTAALFTDENEDLQKALVKVQSATAILSGIQSLQNVLQKESTLNVAAGLVLRKLETYQTQLQTAAESKNIVIRYAAIAAQKALNLVMAANPAALIILGVAALATAVVLLTKDTDDLTESFKNANSELEIFSEVTERASQQATRAGDLALARLKANNASTEEIRRQEHENLAKQTLLAKAEYDKANANYKAYSVVGRKLNKEENEERIKAFDAYLAASSKYYDLENQLAINRIEQQKARNDEALANETAFAEARVATLEKGSQAELRAQITLIQTRQSQQLAAEGLLQGDRARIIAENEASIAALRLQIQQKNYDDQLVIMRTEVIDAEANKANLIKQLNLKTDLINRQAQRDSLGKSAKERLEIEARANFEVVKLREELLGNLDLLRNKDLSRDKKYTQERVMLSAIGAQERLSLEQREAQTRLEILEDEIAKRKEGYKILREQGYETFTNIANTSFQISRNNDQRELNALQEQLDKKLISQEAYDRQVKIIQIRAAQRDKEQAIFQAQIDSALAIIKVFSSVAWPLSLGVATLIGANTIAQVAEIKSRPIPSFWTGTKNAPAGPAWLAERGSEIRESKTGVRSLVRHKGVYNLEKGDKIYNAQQTKMMLKGLESREMPSFAYFNPSTVYNRESTEIDYQQLAYHIGRELSKQTVEAHVYDDRGYNKYKMRAAEYREFRRSKKRM